MQKVWIYQPQQHELLQNQVQPQILINRIKSNENVVRSSESDLFDVDCDDEGNYDSNTSTGSTMREHFESHVQRKMRKFTIKKLKICKLDSISIPSSSDNVQHVLNLKQEFTFPLFSSTQKDSAAQTPALLEFRQKTPHPNVNFKNCCREDQEKFSSRPQSMPAEAMSSHKINIPRVTADFKPNQNIERIGDGIDNNLKSTKQNECGFIGRDLELVGAFPACQSPVQCVLIKPK